MILRITLILLLPAVLYSQEPSYIQYLPEDGMPSPTVYRIKQDSEGMMWLATEKGICSFDGFNFRTYNSADYRDHMILGLVIDKNDKIWHFNVTGNLYIIENSKVHAIEGYKFDEYPIEVMKIIEETLFLVLKVKGKRKLVSYKIQGNKISFLDELTTNDKAHYISINEFENYLVFIEMYEKFSHVSHFNVDTNEEKYKFKKQMKSNDVFPISLEDNFIVRIGNIIQFRGDSIVAEFEKKNRVHLIKKIKDEYHVLSDDGLEVILFENGKISGLKSVISGFQILGTTEDKEGSIWIGTRNSGLLYIPKNSSTIYNKDNSNLTSDFVRTLALDENNDLFAGMDNGTVAHQSDDVITVIPQYFGNEINEIIAHKNSLIVASNRNLSKYDRSKNQIESMMHSYKDIHLVNDKEMLSGTSDDFRLVSIEDGLKPIKHISRNRTYASGSDHNGKYWAGTVKGLFVYANDATNTVDTLLNYNISDIEIVDNVAYVGTFANGVFEIEEYKVRKHFSASGELSSNNINDLYFSNNELYISTDNGLNIVDVSNNEIEYLSKSEGLPTKNIMAAIPIDNFIWVATSKGLCKINRLKKEKPHVNYLLNANSIEINDLDTVLEKSYKLESNQRRVEMSFSTPQYSTKDYIDFYSRNLKRDTTWLPLYENQFVYNNLDYGSNLIQVQAINRNNLAKSEIFEIEFDVKTPFVNHKWFPYLLALVILSAIFLLWMTYIRNQHKVEKELLLSQKKMEGFKLTALQNHMNPHFISNSLFTIQDLLDNENRWKASEFTSNFAELVRHSMRLSTKERISLEEELDFLEKYIELEKMRFDKPIESTIKIDRGAEAELESILIPPLLVQPLVENVFKHANLFEVENPILKIQFENSNGSVICKVSDNGIGFNRLKNNSTTIKKKSTGLKTIEERLKLNAKQLEKLNEQEKLVKLSEEADDDQTLNTVCLKIYYP